ncbi:MAG: hypothetical protein OES32_10005 [Acidobacteriota bacterium]|nr:hypothetical protein [Acidobacteriota bacterium]MDH3523906.1 hypothetical protein [Acidobacteriota bacterium]
MNYLTALLAFSAVMIVLSTVATVAVEFLHKLGRKRAQDFEELLSQLYTQAIEPRLDKAEVVVTSSVADFVRDIRKNPAFDAGKEPRYAKWPVLRRLFDTSFEQLTTRQFVEQFAQTEAGRKLRAKGRDEVTALIGKFSYEFERYGDAATDFFKRRATTLSVAVAFLLALFLNIDAIKLFSVLAEDETLVETVIASVDVAKLETKAQQQIESAGDEQAKAAIREELDAVLATIKEESRSLQGLGLPIGFAYFPFCEAREGEKPVDARCEGVPSSDFRSDAKWIGGALTVLVTTLENAWLRVFSKSAGWGWLFSIAAAGGLIGLGAPFWFKTYRAVADFIPGLKSQDRTQERGGGGGQTTPAPSAPAGQGALPPGAVTVLVTGPEAAPAPGTAAAARGVAPDEGAGRGRGVEPPAPGGPVVAVPAAGTAAAAATLQMATKGGLSETDLYRAFDQSDRD